MTGKRAAPRETLEWLAAVLGELEEALVRPDVRGLEAALGRLEPIAGVLGEEIEREVSAAARPEAARQEVEALIQRVGDLAALAGQAAVFYERAAVQLAGALGTYAADGSVGAVSPPSLSLEG